jgi:hypothetical protein
MFESNNPYSPEGEAPKPTYQELEQAVANLNSMLRESSAKTKSLIDWEYKAEKLEEWLDEEGESLTKRQVEEICEIFGFDTDVTKTVRVEVQFDLEIKAPRGFDFSDLDENSFNVSITQDGYEDWSISNEDGEITHVSVDD